MTTIQILLRSTRAIRATQQTDDEIIRLAEYLPALLNQVLATVRFVARPSTRSWEKSFILTKCSCQCEVVRVEL
jgi:hypothetical protein